MIKIEKKIKDNNTVYILKFKTFEEIQNLYEVISLAVNSDFLICVDYDSVSVLTAFANAMIIGKVGLEKPVLYLFDGDEFDSYDSLTNVIYGLCGQYLKNVKELGVSDCQAFTTIAKQYIKAYEKVK